VIILLHLSIRWLAASAGQHRCVEKLLELGADVTLVRRVFLHFPRATHPISVKSRMFALQWPQQVDDDGLDASARALQKGHTVVTTMIANHLREQGAKADL